MIKMTIVSALISFIAGIFFSKARLYKAFLEIKASGRKVEVFFGDKKFIVEVK